MRRRPDRGTADPDVLDTVPADKTHRHHTIIEQIHADLEGLRPAHLPSGVGANGIPGPTSLTRLGTNHFEVAR